VNTSLLILAARTAAADLDRLAALARRVESF
jgi:hypothetical protein